MSSGGGHAGPKGLSTRLIQASALAVLFAVLYGATRAVPTIQSNVGTIAAVGFLLLSGTLTSELVEVVGLPHLSGYLAAGIIAGPHVLRLVDEHSVVDLTHVNALALALIALEGGAHLKVETLKKGVKSLAWATLLQSLAGILVMMVVFVSLHRFIPFADKLTTSALVGTGLLWGTLAITRSPSATLGIMSQTRAKGPVMTGTLSFVMTSDVVVVVLLATAMVIARPLIDPTTTFSMHDFEELGHDVFGSVALGTTLGLILAIYMRVVGRQLLVVFLALGFGMSELLAFLHFDTLLAFMVAGFVVQNLSKQGEKFIAAIEQTGSIVYVIFFATAGAHLDLDLLRQLWPIAVALAGSRLLVTLVTGRVASRLAKDPPMVRRWAWAGLVSQAGLALGVAAVIERSFPILGSGFRALSIAVVALNEMVGPVLFKLALDRAGESSREPQLSLPAIEMAARASKAHLQVDARASQDPAAHS
jgi:Kef-type K+ transport system membrane component KefB